MMYGDALTKKVSRVEEAYDKVHCTDQVVFLDRFNLTY